MKERKRFLLYYDWENLIQDMSDTDIASLTRGIFQYQNTGEIGNMTYGAKLAFSFMRPVFDEDKKDWEEVREKRRIAGSEGGKAKASASKSKQILASASKSKQNIAVIDNDIDSVNDITETDISIDTEQVPNESEIIIEKSDSFGKEEINLMQGFLRQAVGVTQFKDSKERWYVTHCYNLMKKIGKDEFQKRLKEILSDPFKSNNCNKLSYLYGEMKSYIHSPVIEKNTKNSIATF